MARNTEKGEKLEMCTVGLDYGEKTEKRGNETHTWWDIEYGENY